ncbi:MAG: O-acetyl-ADP-ribose deacetylase [Patescibacteria group bacterium]
MPNVKSKIKLIKGDITTFEGDAIVNAAKSELTGGGGVDGSIHQAGGPEILSDCKVIVRECGPLSTGGAVFTTGGNLKTKHVIHAVGPKYWEHKPERANELLASCYRRSMEIAETQGFATIAFPCISTGVYKFPKQKAAEIAIATVSEFLKKAKRVKEVTFIVFSEGDLEIYRKLLRAEFSKEA